MIRNCSVPGYANATLGPWQTIVGVNMAVDDACASGGGVRFRAVGSRELTQRIGSALVSAAACRTTIAIELVKVSLWFEHDSRVRARPTCDRSYAEPDGEVRSWEITGPPGSESLSVEHVLRPGKSVTYAVVLLCGPLNPPRPPELCVPDHATPLEVHGMEVTLSEDTQPEVSRPAGTLLTVGPQRGVRTVSYSASDPQSGLTRIDVLLDSRILKSIDLTPQCSYSDFTVCPSSDEQTLEIDTRAVPNGLYDLALRVTDAAGNQQLVHGERAVEVANEVPTGSTASANALRLNRRELQRHVTTDSHRAVRPARLAARASHPGIQGGSRRHLDRGP